MTCQDLVDAVDALWSVDSPIVEGAAIEKWCDENGRVYDDEGAPGRKNRFLEDADHGEGSSAGRLAKFKRGDYQHAPVGWCRIEHAEAAEAWGLEQGWRRLEFDGVRERWVWKAKSSQTE